MGDRMRQQLDRSRLARIVQAEDVRELPFDELVALFRAEIEEFLPDSAGQFDPRNGDLVIFCPARHRRPHDNRPVQPDGVNEPAGEQPCVICQGDTTGVVDVADLSTGFTFINKNLYPIVHPSPVVRSDYPGPPGQPIAGLHFVQWTSSLHDRDWHNMPVADCAVVMKRLAVLEEHLLVGSQALFSADKSAGSRCEDRYAGCVSIIKNYGHLVGGSLEHGHQQIWLSNLPPRRILDHRRFQEEHGETFSAYLMRENPADFLVRDYGPAALVVPYFMRRPYDMLLLVKDAHKAYLHELSGAEVSAVAEGWHDAIRAIRSVMRQTGRELAYNVVTHNGAGAGLYFEFLPYVQEIGGAEHLGLFVCQGDPRSATMRLRRCLA